MQFKYPELLYALFVLIIPILVHLFQLQRYTKVPFTNVQLLKNIERETRKSARLKKWLVLVTRMLALACIIIAFAQPFTSEYTANEEIQTSIYIDNSLSMKAKGSNGELLREQINAFIENGTYENDNISFHANFYSFNQNSPAQLKESLISLGYQSYPVNFENELLRIQTQGNLHPKSRLVIISDFQAYQYAFSELLNSLENETLLMKTTPVRSNNISIDSVYTSDYSATNITINAIIESQTPTSEAISVTLYNGPAIYGKTSVELQNNTGIASFSIPTNQTFMGKLSVEDNSLAFDNDFYFTYTIPKTIEILNIGKNPDYLRKIFDQASFNFQTSSLNQVNYGELNDKQFIVLNEIEEFSNALVSQIRDFVVDGGHVLVIPAVNADRNSYNQLFETMGMGSMLPKETSTLKITDINFEHPIFNKVFDRNVDNFQYPTSNAHFVPSFGASTPILSFQNRASFINATSVESGQVYFVSSPLTGSDSNFTNSPLIVPVFYNMATQSHGIQEIQYKIATGTTIDVNTSIRQDEVLSLQNENLSFIPVQKISKNKVTLALNDQVQKSGFYNVIKGDASLKQIALNYSRKESKLDYVAVENLSINQNISITNSIENLLAKIDASYEINWLFKWFLAFSVLFLFFEMLILKYFKL